MDGCTMKCGCYYAPVLTAADDGMMMMMSSLALALADVSDGESVITSADCGQCQDDDDVGISAGCS